MILVDLDFETASKANLKLVGARRYAQDPSTRILCLLFTRNGETFEWLPSSRRCECFLGTLAASPDTIFVAHNAGFEQAVWEEIMLARYGFPAIPVERWEDSMATAAWKSIPLALDTGARAMRLPVEKDKDGNRLTLGMSRPDRKTGELPEPTPEQLDRIIAYCRQDVVVETALRKRIGLLSQQSRHERAVWCLDQRINNRGIRIDIPFVRQALEVVERSTGPLLAEFADLTGGLAPGQVAEIVAWCGRQGTHLDNLQKTYLDELLDGDQSDDDAGYTSLASPDDLEPVMVPGERLVPVVRRVLEIRRLLGSASIKKLHRMLACVCDDGRARGLLQYHAAHPGRWGGRLLQPQNFPRPDFRGADDKQVSIPPGLLVEAIMTGDPEMVELLIGWPAIECVAYALRHALIPDPGHVFLVGDYSGIEARIVLALAGQHDKTAMMAAGQDVYCDMAERIYGHAVTKKDVEKRQAGKGGVLGCGFQCGPGTFNIKFLGGKDLALAERVVPAYRNDWAPKVPPVWYGLEAAALGAFERRSTEAYGVEFRREDEWLTARLPSGWQKIWYHRPIQYRDEAFNKAAWKYTAYKGGKVVNTKAYGGLLTENAVQGLARGLLVAAMMRLEKAGLPVVLTVHDEIVCEVDIDRADFATFKTLMEEPTEWAREMRVPITVEGDAMERYRK